MHHPGLQMELCTAVRQQILDQMLLATEAEADNQTRTSSLTAYTRRAKVASLPFHSPLYTDPAGLGMSTCPKGS